MQTLKRKFKSSMALGKAAAAIRAGGLTNDLLAGPVRGGHGRGLAGALRGARASQGPGRGRGRGSGSGRGRARGLAGAVGRAQAGGAGRETPTGWCGGVGGGGGVGELRGRRSKVHGRCDGSGWGCCCCPRRGAAECARSIDRGGRGGCSVARGRAGAGHNNRGGGRRTQQHCRGGGRSPAGHSGGECTGWHGRGTEGVGVLLLAVQHARIQVAAPILVTVQGPGSSVGLLGVTVLDESTPHFRARAPCLLLGHPHLTVLISAILADVIGQLILGPDVKAHAVDGPVCPTDFTQGLFRHTLGDVGKQHRPRQRALNILVKHKLAADLSGIFVESSILCPLDCGNDNLHVRSELFHTLKGCHHLHCDPIFAREIEAGLLAQELILGVVFLPKVKVHQLSEALGEFFFLLCRQGQWCGGA
eukprot:m.236644 g.236644  ORF g.236644 m.236644 type:complete len:418 (+) comp20690_c0_seq1:332-1585(+)